MNTKCLECSKETNNPKYCSRSCAAINTNRIPKRKRSENSTCSCGNYKIARVSACTKCIKKKRDERTLGDFLYKNPRFTESTNVSVRKNARWNSREIEESCCLCGYNKHAEIAHIKPITSFSPETLISVVNGFDNLSFLCPNCHWEFDNGLLESTISLSGKIVPAPGFAPESRP